MPTDTIYCTDDGRISGTNAGSYATARSTSTSCDDTATTDQVGQSVYGPVYTVMRLFFGFDTSAIPAGATITGATLYLCADSDNSTTDFDIKVYRYAWSSALCSSQEANYDGAYGGSATLEGTLRNTASGWTGGTYYSMAVDPAGINTSGFTRYTVVSSRDVSNTTPTANEYVGVRMGDYAGKTSDPYLEVTYTLSGQPTAVRSFGIPFARLPGFGGARLGG